MAIIFTPFRKHYISSMGERCKHFEPITTIGKRFFLFFNFNVLVLFTSTIGFGLCVLNILVSAILPCRIYWEYIILEFVTKIELELC